nr:uncharacterized protein LOC125975256 [Syngnathus scovelli]
MFRRQKIRKAPGPDGVSPSCLKVCAEQLAPTFARIFNRSLELCEVPSCFKSSTIVPVAKKPAITVLNHLKDVTGPLLDPLQFAYRANRSVDDAVNMGLHYILQHLDTPGKYARILFVDFSSAFNTIAPDILQQKLIQLAVPASTYLSKENFKRFVKALVNRRGNIKVSKNKVQDKNFMDVTEVLVSTFTEDKAPAVVSELLITIKCADEAEKLGKFMRYVKP